MQLEETVSNILRAALSKASLVPCSQHRISQDRPAVSSDLRGTHTFVGRKRGGEKKKNNQKKNNVNVKKKKRPRSETAAPPNRPHDGVVSRLSDAKQEAGKPRVCCREAAQGQIESKI